MPSVPERGATDDGFGEQLQAALGETYSLERELGGGGMSRVFVAEERALARKVVIKVISPELAESVSSDRFAREIRLAASLQQANIVPLFAAGVVSGLAYYTMPFVAGQSLRHRLNRATAGLPIGDVVSILRDVARALAYAHEQGVIHRDIKPENVLLSGDAAVVTDFGIAKAITAAWAGSPSETITSIGLAIGTPAYMSPEQAVGDPSIDHRADIYSFGCLAYELLAGRPPFSGRDAVQLLVAHVHGSVAPVSDLRSDTPAALAAIVDQCLDKNRANRPQTARDVLQMLDSLSTSSGAVAAGPRRALSGRVIAAAIVLAAIGAAVAARSHFVADDSGSRTLAVMPFTNVGGDTSQEYFADGIAIDLTNALSKVPGLRVASRSLAFTYQGKRVDVRSVGRDLNVGTVLEGTVQRSGRRVRVTSQLTRTADGISLWSNTYERDAEDLFGIQDTIAKSIANELRLAFAPTSTARPAVAGTANLAAYDSYLRGVYLLEHRGAGVSGAIKFFKDAVAQDSGLARAYGTLSEALELIPYFSPTPAATVEAEALGAAQRALALDSTVVDAHVGLALAREHASRWADADAEYQRALALDPTSATVHLQYGRHLMALGRVSDAMKEYQRATTLDPASGTAFVWLAHMLSLSGAGDSALAVGRRARELDPGLVLARTYGAVDAARAGRRDLAEGLASGIEGSPPWIGIAAYALAATGNTTAARARLRDLEHLPRDTWLLHTGLAYAELGLADTTRALADLELALRSREITPKWATFSDPIYDAVRKSARFAAVVRGFGLDDGVLTSPLGGRPAR